MACPAAAGLSYPYSSGEQREQQEVRAQQKENRHNQARQQHHLGKS